MSDNKTPLTLFGIPVIEKEFMGDEKMILVSSPTRKVPLEITEEMSEDGAIIRYVARIKKEQ